MPELSMQANGQAGPDIWQENPKSALPFFLPIKQRPSRFSLQNAGRILVWGALYLLLTAGIFAFPSFATHDLDQSWRMTLGYAFEHQLQFGTDIVVTFGPLGFVMGNAFSGLQFWRLIAGQLTLALISAGAIVHLGWRLPNASRLLFFAFFLLFGISYDFVLHILVIAILGFELLRLVEQPRPWLSAVIALLLAGYAQIKFTHLLFASFCVLTALLYALTRRRYRAAAWLFASYAGAFIASWIACGQDLRNLADYFYYSWQLSEGFQWAMSLPTPSAPLSKALVIATVLAGYAVLHFRLNPNKTRAVANVLLLGAFLFLQWKHGFIRADGHMLGFFYGALLPLTAYPALLEDTNRARKIHYGVLLATMVFCLWGVTDVYGDFVRQAGPRLQAKVTGNFTAIANWQKTRQRYRDQLAQERRDYDLPLTREIGGRAPVDVLGFEQGIAIFNRLNYQPRPVFQSYCTYMPALAKLNETFYASPRAPLFVLSKIQAIDGRLPAMDDAPVLFLLAHGYEYVRSENNFTLWKRTAGSFDPFGQVYKPLRATTLALNTPCSIDNPDQKPLWLTLDLQPSWLGRLRHLFYKLPPVMLTIQDDTGSTRDCLLPLPQGRSGFLITPLIEDQTDFLLFSRNHPQKHARSISIKIATADAKYFYPTAKIELTALPAPATKPLPSPNESEFNMFQSYPISYFAPGGLTVEKLDGRTAAILHARSWLVFDLPTGATTISGMFGLLPGAYTNGNKTDGAEFSVYWSDGCQRIDLYQKSLDPLNWPSDRGWQTFSAELTDLTHGKLYLEISPGQQQNAAWDWTGWTNIHIK